MAMYSIVTSENEEERTKIHAVENATINAGVVISVLGIRLMGIVEKNDGAVCVLVCSPNESLKQSVTLKSVCDKAGIQKEDQDSMGEVIKYLGFSGGIDKVNFDVRQVFYYCNSSEKNESGKVKQEYAFSLGVTNDGTPDPNCPFNIESISISLWNSTRPKIIESMNLHTISDLLERYS